MARRRLRQLLAVAGLAALLSVGSAAVGDGGSTSTRTRLPATVEQVNLYIEQARGLRTLAEVRAMSGAQPVPVAPLVYRWRLANGHLDTVTMRTKDGEVITCWGPLR
jgi:hypothetical protein